MFAVIFGQSTSVSYLFAVRLAQGASKYSQSIFDNKSMHLAGFKRTREQVARAVALLKIIIGWKSTKVFISTGIESSAHHVLPVLECYLQSSSNKDHRAHCHWIHRDYGTDVKFMVPCLQLRGSVNWIIEDQGDHSSSLEDRVQALAIRNGCSWCPNFNANDFRSV